MVTAPVVELLINNEWVLAVVRYEGPGGRSVVIERDRGSEMERFRGATCNFTLGNTDGRYSPRNPASPYYGHLIRNLPVRVMRQVVSDGFDTPVVDGWGSAYTLSGGVAGDYDVAAGVAMVSTGSANQYYRASVTGMTRRDAMVRATVTPGVVATGAILRMGVMARYADASNHVAADVRFGTSGTADVQLIKRVAGADGVLATSALTLAYDATTSIVVEFTVESGYLHARAHDVTAPETVIEVSVTDSSVSAAGSCGVRVRRDTGNGNGTTVVEVDDLAVRDVRFSGEIEAFAPQIDSTATDSWLSVTARSAMERLSDSGRVKWSAPRRWFEALAAIPPAACWPLEEGEAAEAGWPLFGRFPLRPWSGTHTSGAVVTHAKFGRGELAAWLPDGYSWSGTTGLSILAATVEMPTFVAADGWTVDFLVAIDGDAGDLAIDINPSYLGGSAAWPQLTLDTSAVSIATAMNGEAATNTARSSLFTGLVRHVRWHAYQDGANVSWTVAVDGVTAQTDTTAGAMALAAVRYIGLVSAAQAGTQAAVGYVAVWSGDPPAGGTQAYTAHDAETVEERLERLTTEVGIAYAPDPTAPSSATMGPQPTDTIGAAIEEPEAVDLGSLYDMRYARGVGLRTRTSMLTQSPALTLDHSAGHLLEPIVPIDGTASVANDVIAKSSFGGSRRFTVTDGPLGTADPGSGGVGLQQRPIEVNTDDDSTLSYAASWVAHLGTVDAPRIPAVVVGLHRPEVVALVDDVLNVRTGDTIKITNPPTNIFAPDDITGIVIGSAEKWDQFEHTIGFSLVPDLVQSNIGIWDDATGGNRWNSDASSLAAAFTTGTDTTMSVAVEAGHRLWLTGTGSSVDYVGVATDDSGATTQTSFAPGWPAAYTPTDGDDGVLIVHYGGTSITVNSPPSGWSAWPGVSNPIDQGTSSRAYVYYRRIQSTDSAPTIGVSGSATGVATLVVVTGGVSAGAGAQIGEADVATASNTSIGLPTLTGVQAGSMVVAFASARVPTGTAIPSGITPDGDYTERSDVATSRNTATSQNVRQSSATRAITSGGTLSGDTFTTDQTSSLIAGAIEVVTEPGSTEGDFPFDINVSGSRLTVTNITGSTSPQTFTVAQAPVNGVIKTAPVGAKVELWRPVRWTY